MPLEAFFATQFNANPPSSVIHSVLRIRRYKRGPEPASLAFTVDMPLLWGKTRCKETAGWDGRIAAKLVAAGEQGSSDSGNSGPGSAAVAAVRRSYAKLQAD